jgi:predicted DNA-binding protein with PD1-like motif
MPSLIAPTLLPLPLRLMPGDDLRRALEAAVATHGGQAAFVLSGIGSLGTTKLRLAGADLPIDLKGDVEILTLAGSIGTAGSHLHASIADATGRVLGGHVAYGCIVRTTAEVLIALLPGHRFDREADRTTGFEELVVRPAT